MKINRRIVTITKVSNNSVTHNEGLSADISNFPNAKVGQQWELVTDDTPPLILGKILNAKLIKDVD